MAQILLPEFWCKRVCALLQTEATGTVIEWTFDAQNRYEADFFPSWTIEVYAPFRQYLSQPTATGCLVSMKKPVGETYEFLFPYKNKSTYGKILLHSNYKRIVIFSAHLPLKKKLSCE